MKNLSIKKRLWFLAFISVFLVGAISGAGIYLNDKLSRSVTDLGLVQIKSVREMTLADMKHDAIRATIYGAFVYAAEKEKLMELNVEFKQAAADFQKSLDSLKQLNNDDPQFLSELSKTHEKMLNYNEEGNNIFELLLAGKATEAQGKMSVFEKSFEELASVMEVTGDAIQNEASLKAESDVAFSALAAKISVAAVLFGVSGLLLTLYFFSKSLLGMLKTTNQRLMEESMRINATSSTVAEASERLSEATTEQAASLQETVASIDEISAMVSRNADSANASAKNSETTTISAQKGKDKVEQMLDSIHSIAQGNDEIISQMQKSNKEISDIVVVIKEISDKTQVINDIVFQTKLLSFNASVEAARAGEHGKGFAVVAEEVGNLASMSGKAATEITEMLSRSVKRVTDIVESTKDLMDNLIKQSKQKIDFGTETARECAQALDEILVNVSSVNDMVREISNASTEQSTGVREINKAMSELDQVTQANSAIAQESSHTGKELKTQADRLGELVNELTIMVEGRTFEKADLKIEKMKVSSNNENVISLKKPLKVKEEMGDDVEMKKVVGLELRTPKKSDKRFEDV